jgi:hypothetical protein
MRSSLVLLLAAPLLACFADNGGRATATIAIDPSTSSGTGTTEIAGTDTTVADTTADIDEPTTTTTDIDGTTAPTDNCQLAPECQVGAVEDGPQCDSCGVMRRTCQTDCTWTPMTCQQDLDTCAYWMLPPDASAWKRVPVDPDAAFAPKDPVLAAIGLVPQKQIYALTATSYHVLSTATETWTAAGDRDALFPQLAGLPLYHATGLTTEPPDTIVTLVAGTQAFSYTYVGAQNTLEYVSVLPCCGDDWKGPNAPDPFAVRDSWTRLGDPDAWLPGDPQTLCDLPEPKPIYAYQLSIGDGFVYPQDIGYCFDFYPPIPYEQFPPFTLTGAPANDLVGGAVHVDALWVFRGE